MVCDLMTKKILVVDDEEDIRDTLKTILEKEKFTVVTGKEGADAVKLATKEKPDLILLDIMMPGLPVKEVIKKIKQKKILFVSAVRMSEAEKEDLTKQNNVLGYIEKPFNIKELVKQVKKALK